MKLIAPDTKGSKDNEQNNDQKNSIMIELFFRDKSSALDSKAAGATVYEGKLKIQRGVLQCKRKLLISEGRIQIVDRDRSTIVIDNKRLLRAVRLIGDTDSVAALVQQIAGTCQHCT